jgi:hypothetical protein
MFITTKFKQVLSYTAGILAGVLTFSACSNDIEEGFRPGQFVEIIASADQTRVIWNENGSGVFENGDQVSLWYSESTDKPGSGGSVMRYELGRTALTWEEVRPDGINLSEEVVFKAWYPTAGVGLSLEGFSSTPLDIAGNPELANLSFATAHVRPNRPVHLNFRRALHAMAVELTAENHTADELRNARVTPRGVDTHIRVDFTQGTPVVTSVAMATGGSYPTKTGLRTEHVVAPQQNIPVGTTLFDIEIGQNTYSYTTSASLSLRPGFRQGVALHVSEEGSVTMVEMGDWNIGGWEEEEEELVVEPPVVEPPVVTDGTSPAEAVARFEAYMSKADYEANFPHRYGVSAFWQEFFPTRPRTDYYSYENLRDAIKEMADLVYTIEYRQEANGSLITYREALRLSVYRKSTGVTTLIMEGSDFVGDWNLHKPIVREDTDFGAFLGRGTDNDRRRELVAFLANLAHETGEKPVAQDPDGVHGLFWNEEVHYFMNPGTTPGYVADWEPIFPPVAGKSYHGRGPIQISWNYNYGLFSAIRFQNPMTLLQNPEMVVESGSLGFQSALWFWMTPQAPKASCHQVMTPGWQPTRTQDAQYAGGGFGVTIIIINGGLESGLAAGTDGRVDRRINYYRNFARRIGADITGEKLDTGGLSPWA